jgi:hypothetical protein
MQVYPQTSLNFYWKKHVQVSAIEMFRTSSRLFSKKFPGSGCSTKINFEKLLQSLCISACRAESIDILFVEINTLVEK